MLGTLSSLRPDSKSASLGPNDEISFALAGHPSPLLKSRVCHHMRGVYPTGQQGRKKERKEAKEEEERKVRKEGWCEWKVKEVRKEEW